MRKILILDQSNFFMRYYIVNPSISINGEQIGGLLGSLLGLQKLVKEIKPNIIISCFDGGGGSRKRKLLNKNYKEGRSPPRLNWNSPLLSERDKNENKAWQYFRLYEYYDYMPIIKFKFDDIEADDLIATICKLDYFKEDQKIILSSDKDFIQLLDNKTILYRPIQKEILNIKRTIKKYGIHPNNFSVARSIIGDKSDNIEGVKGIGISGVVKRFPFLYEKKEYSIEDLIKFSKENINIKNKTKFFDNIINNEEKIKLNYQLTQLSNPKISFQCKEEIKKKIKDRNLIWNKTQFFVMMMKDGFSVWDWSILERCYNRILRDDV